LWQGHLILREEQEVTLLLPGQMPYIPADAVHGLETLAGLRLSQTNQGPLELTSGKAQLRDEWMNHQPVIPFFTQRVAFKAP
jgi:hypothetical protein